MLDILERCIGEPKALGGLGLEMARIDGSHSDLERKDTIAKFNGDEDIAVCLVRCVYPGGGGCSKYLAGLIFSRIGSISFGDSRREFNVIG